jgi:hypothetical protein
METRKLDADDRNRMTRARFKVAGSGLMGVAAFLLATQFLTPLLRADDPSAPTSDDPTAGQAPAARAIRLSSVDGQVQIAQGKQVLAASGVANTPLFEGTTITTAEDGRAEIQFEDGSTARLSPNSALTLTVLRGSGSSGEAELTLDGGLGYFELQGADHTGQIKVHFGDSVVTPSGFSVLRINLDTPPGEVAVFSGNAHLERGSAAAVDMHGGESVTLSSDDASRYTLNETIEPDSWDSWNSDRDQVLTSEAAAKTGATKDYADSGNPAWNDLDANGNWYNVPGEGNIWSPNEAQDSNWDPYGNGSWGFSPGFGYTWISGNSWGYLPYSCGSWNFYNSFGWGWAPGAGGCNPWWGGGGYYGPNIGYGYGGYRPPTRPHAPHHPLGNAGLIAVNRRTTGPHVILPARDRGGVVNIGGHTVMAYHPVNPRPMYDHSASGFVNHAFVANGSAGSGYGGTGYRVGNQPRGVAGGPTFATPSRTASGNAGTRSFTTAGTAHAASSGGASASHASSVGGFSGGGGGGGGHAGGGGGGGHH